MRRAAPAAVMVGAGLLTLAGQFTDAFYLGELSGTLVRWAGIVFAFALVLGLLNLLAVHGRRVRERADGWMHSAVLIGAALLTLLAGWSGASAAPAQWIFEHVRTPLESTLLALPVFFVVSAAVRAFQPKRGSPAGGASPSGRGVAVMLLTAMILLLAQLPLAERLSGGMAATRDWLLWALDIPALAGMRGILLGVALGTLGAGIRMLSGTERDRFFQ